MSMFSVIEYIVWMNYLPIRGLLIFLHRLKVSSVIEVNRMSTLIVHQVQTEDRRQKTLDAGQTVPHLRQGPRVSSNRGSGDMGCD